MTRSIRSGLLVSAYCLLIALSGQVFAEGGARVSGKIIVEDGTAPTELSIVLRPTGTAGVENIRHTQQKGPFHDRSSAGGDLLRRRRADRLCHHTIQNERTQPLRSTLRGPDRRASRARRELTLLYRHRPAAAFPRTDHRQGRYQRCRSGHRDRESQGRLPQTRRIE